MVRRPRAVSFWGGIRGRLLRSYLVLMLLTVLALLAVGLAGLEWYYRHAIGGVLRAQGTATQQFWGRIQQGLDLTLAGQDLAQEFAAQVPARVQLYRADGRLVGDSTLPARPRGLSRGDALIIPTPADVTAVFQGQDGVETVARAESGERTLHLAVRLAGGDGQPAGVLRLSSSLATVDQLLVRVGAVAALLSLGLLALTAAIGLVLARSVVQPLTELTRVAEAMGAGELGQRARVHFPDEVGRLAETLNRMAVGLSELDRLRSEFLRTVSHELRTPLAAIKAWSVTLQDGEAPAAELHTGLTAIEQSTDHLTRLVEDLLTAARIQAGAEIALHPRPVDAQATVATICQALLPRARSLGVDLAGPSLQADNGGDAGSAGPGQLPAVCFDPDRLSQVVTNLLENALKFTPRGGRVSATLTATDDAVLLRVQDTGVGIAPADLPQVTQKFFRAAGASSIPGTGLGLAIVSDLLQRSGGALALSSEPGRGTTAIARLPSAGRDTPCA